MAKESDGYISFDRFTLTHMDIVPRNILVDPAVPNPGNMITGILDWADALFAPIFMPWRPPLWLWAWEDNKEEDERTAKNIPPTGGFVLWILYIVIEVEKGTSAL